MEDNSKVLKKGFFKKVWYSIFKLEKYGEMAAEGIPRAISYTIKLALIISLAIGLVAIYETNQLVEKGKDFIETQVGEFTYNDGILTVKNGDQITAPSTRFGEIIINTNIEDTEQAEQLLDTIEDSRGIVLVKDKVLAKGISSKGILLFKYSDLANGTGITELNKQDVLEFFNQDNAWKICVAAGGAVLISMLIAFILQFLWYNVLLAIFGFLVTFFSSIKMRFAAIFNMSCYAFTLSILLQTVYLVVQAFTHFEIKYFQVMYIAVAAIYLIAAIFLIKSEFVKQQIETAKLEEIRKKEAEKEDKEREDNKDNKKPEDKKEKAPEEPKTKDNKGKNKDKKEGTDGVEPEGSQA